MKRITPLIPFSFLMTLVLLVIVACGSKTTNSYTPGDTDSIDNTELSDRYSYRVECPGDSAVNHTHAFAIENVYPTNLLGMDGWYCETCQYCGQEFMFSNDFECVRHEGTVCAFRSPETGQFTDFCVCSQDESGQYRYTTVSRDQLRYNPQPEDEE